jgi:hypothetical protein
MIPNNPDNDGDNNSGGEESLASALRNSRRLLSTGEAASTAAAYLWTVTFQVSISPSEVGIADAGAAAMAASVTTILSFFLWRNIKADPLLSSIGLSGAVAVEATSGNDNSPSFAPSSLDYPSNAATPSSCRSSHLVVGLASTCLFLLVVMLVCAAAGIRRWRRRSNKTPLGLTTSKHVERLREHGFTTLDDLLDHLDRSNGQRLLDAAAGMSKSIQGKGVEPLGNGSEELKTAAPRLPLRNPPNQLTPDMEL